MRARVILLLALMCGAVAAQRLRTYGEPFEHDLMMYAVIGHELLHGGSLYTAVNAAAKDRRAGVLAALGVKS